MSNWAKLQEDLTGLPVAKRAKHGIHFQKGDQIEAHFVGKPCHFQENGIWKPIDTALLATADGWYSSPHSDVVIHPDGRMRVRNSDYQQFTELPSAKAGRLDGDKIIREFPGGEQHLIMKEDGFREEIHVFKPTFKIEKFIAKTAGNLPSKYRAHPVTAEDAEGNVYEYKENVAEFGAWLDKAVYPVVIDPDFTTSGSFADYYWAGKNADYATARSTAWNTFWSSAFNNLLIGQNFDGSNYWVYRVYLAFDTSSIDDGETISQSNLKLTYKADSSSIDFDVQIAKISTVNYAGALSATLDDNIWGNGNGKTLNTQYTSGNLSTAWINKTGLTKYALRSSRDSDNTAPTGSEYCSVYDYETATESYRPVLTVTYSAGGVPKHFMHYQRMRSL